MAFVKLDCGILNSTLWVAKDQRDIFITALLMAVPFELVEPTPQIEVRTLNYTGFMVPPGWYGFVASASVGIIRQALMELDSGMAALECLGNPDQESRTHDHEGRRMVRVDGGFLILNYQKYREKDHTAAQRMRAFRERKRNTVTRNSDGATRNSYKNVTEAEAEAEADNRKATTPLELHSNANGNSASVNENQPANALPHKQQAIEVLEFLNTKTGMKYRAVDASGRPTANLKLIMDRLRTGVTVQDCKTVIARKHKDWSKAGQGRHGKDMFEYLRPKTLFTASNFESYLGQCVLPEEERRKQI